MRRTIGNSLHPLCVTENGKAAQHAAFFVGSGENVKTKSAIPRGAFVVHMVK